MTAIESNFALSNRELIPSKLGMADNKAKVSPLGTVLGITLGILFGEREGSELQLGVLEDTTEGFVLGSTVGVLVGALLDRSEGPSLGITLDSRVGKVVGKSEGPSLGITLGSRVGPTLGRSEGS